jgi:hypothetical protein
MEYLEGETKILFSSGTVIRAEDYHRWKASGVLKSRFHLALKNPACNGYDFDHALASGVLKRKRAGRDSDFSVREKEEEEAIRDLEKLEEKKAPPARAERKTFSSELVVEAIMIFIGLGSAVMSAYHTTSFLTYSGKPAWTAVTTGIMMILFSAMAFTAARYFFREKGAVKTFGAVFSVLGLMVVTYSIFSTLAVNFNQFKAQAAAAEEAVYTEIRAAEIVSDTGEDGAILEMTADIASLEKEAEFWRNRSWNRYDAAMEQIRSLRDARTEARRRRETAAEQKTEAAEQKAETRLETIYVFLSRLFRINEEAVRFIVYVIPSCFYDIVAPFALSVVLLIEDTRKKRRFAPVEE